MIKKNLLLVLFILGASTARCSTQEIIVWNAIDPVFHSLNRLALIFSDKNFEIIVISLMTSSILLTFFINALKANHAIILISTLVIGGALYNSVIREKGTLIIWDEVQKRQRIVTDIPELLVVSLSLLSNVESGLIEAAETSVSSGYQSYGNGAGGIGLSVLLEAISEHSNLEDSFVSKTLDTYIEDCVWYEMSLQDTTLTWNTLGRNTDLLSELAKAQNPSNFTTLYSNAAPAGQDVTCTESFAALQASLMNSTAIKNPFYRACERVGLNTQDAQQRLQCEEIANRSLEMMNPTSILQVESFMRQYLISKSLYYAIQEGGDEGVKKLTSRDFVQGGLIQGNITNEYYPLIRGATYSAILVMFIIVALFITTPLAKPAAMFFIGLLVFHTTWGVIDALMWANTIDLIEDIMTSVSIYEWGYDALLTTPPMLIKSLAAVGQMQTYSAMLASIAAAGLGFTSGYGLSQMAGSIMNSVNTMANSATDKIETESKGDELEKIARNAGITSIPNQGFNFNDRVKSYGASKAMEFQTGVSQFDEFEGSLTSAAHQVSKTNAITRGEQSVENNLDKIEYTAGQNIKSSTSGYQTGHSSNRSLFGDSMSDEESFAFQNNRTVTPQMADMAFDAGNEGIVEGMHIQNYQTDGENSHIQGSYSVTPENIEKTKVLMRENTFSSEETFENPKSSETLPSFIPGQENGMVYKDPFTGNYITESEMGNLTPPVLKAEHNNNSNNSKLPSHYGEAANNVSVGDLVQFDIDPKTGQGVFNVSRGSSASHFDESKDVISNTQEYSKGFKMDSQTFFEGVDNQDPTIAQSLFNSDGSINQSRLTTQAKMMAGRMDEMLSKTIENNHSSLASGSGGLSLPDFLSRFGLNAGAEYQLSNDDRDSAHQNENFILMKQAQNAILANSTNSDGSINQEQFTNNYMNSMNGILNNYEKEADEFFKENQGSVPGNIGEALNEILNDSKDNN